jgi:tRNA-dihydrouridine synthase
MIARAALFDPQLFCDFVGKERRNLYQVFLSQADETLSLYGEKFATVFMRKMAAFYVKGMRGAAAYKDRLFAAKSVEEAKQIAKEIWG